MKSNDEYFFLNLSLYFHFITRRRWCAINIIKIRSLHLIISYSGQAKKKNRKNKMNCELMLTYDTPAYMFNVYKNHLSRQTGSRNLTGPKTLPTIWHTYMKLVTKYQISAINSCWEKCTEKYLGRTDGSTDSILPAPSGDLILIKMGIQ